MRHSLLVLLLTVAPPLARADTAGPDGCGSHECGCAHAEALANPVTALSLILGLALVFGMRRKP